ncbi:MAG: glycerophosphodiester phosphodiesterase family protein [Balneolaceae bacterium]
MKKVQFYSQAVKDFAVIAHRGASFYAPENTMSAFELAHQMKADMIEIDVLLSKDNVPIVLHDSFLEGTTNGKGLVKEFNSKKLKQLDAGSWFSKKFQGEKIPTLEEVLKWAKDKISLNIEVKTEAVSDFYKNGIEFYSTQLVRKYEMENHVIFSSFDYRSILHLKKNAPEIATSILYDKRRPFRINPTDLLDKYQPDGFNANWRRLNAREINQIKQKGYDVWVYTVNREKIMRKVIRRGVTGIFTDRPDVLRKVVLEKVERDQG